MLKMVAEICLNPLLVTMFSLILVAK